VTASAFVGGLAQYAQGPERLIAALTFGSAVTLWCTLDARCHGKAFLHSFGWVMFCTWPVGGLVYLIWTRGTRGLLAYGWIAIVTLLAGSMGHSLGVLLHARAQ
jgi:hypothetical protein